jgi:hypothetical protein
MMPYVYGLMAAAASTAAAGGVAVAVTVTRVRRREDEARLDPAWLHQDLTDPTPASDSDETEVPEDYKGRHRLPTIGDRALEWHFPSIAQVAGDPLRRLALRRQARTEAGDA